MPAQLASPGFGGLAAPVDPDAAAAQLEQSWQGKLSPQQAALAWATTARNAAFKLQPEGAEYYRRAWRLLPGYLRPAPI